MVQGIIINFLLCLSVTFYIINNSFRYELLQMSIHCTCAWGLQGIIRLCLSLIFWDWPEQGLWFWFYSMTSSRKLLLNWMWLSQITLQQNLRLLFTRIWLNPCLREIIDLFAVTDNKLHVWLMTILLLSYCTCIKMLLSL